MMKINWLKNELHECGFTMFDLSEATGIGEEILNLLDEHRILFTDLPFEKSMEIMDFLERAKKVKAWKDSK